MPLLPHRGQLPNLGPQGASNQAWPNQPGAHAKHLNLLTFTRTTPALPASLAASDCEACHVGSVPGDAANTHYSNANKRATSPILTGPASVGIDPTFNAQSGAATFTASATAFTCSNISCHGAQVTPGWQTGTMTVDTNLYCRKCHTVRGTATQYNDASGTHNENGNHSGAACSVCHTMTNGSQGALNHFKYLDTPAHYFSPDQKSSDTILFDGVTATGGTYTPKATLGSGNCTVLCHSGNKQHNGNSWSS